MGVVEVHSGLHGVAHLQHVVDGSSGVVGVAGPVDLAGLSHQEEALLVFQKLDALLDVVGQLPLASGGIHGVVHGLAVGQILGDDEGLARTGGQGCGPGLGGDDVVAGLCGNFVVVGAGAVAVHLLELAAGKVLEAGIGQLDADLVVVLAGALVGVECGWGGMVDVDGGHDADLVVLLPVQLLGDGLIGHIAGPGAHVDDAALGLVTGGDGGRRGGGVRAEGGAVVGGHAADFGEGREAQLPLGDGTVVLGGAFIKTCGLDLGGAHAVADEQENILGLFGQAEDAVLLFSSRGSRCGCAGGHRGGAQQTGSRCHSTDLQEIAAGDLTLFHSIYPLFSVLPDLSLQTLWERFHSTVLSRRPKPWPGKEWVKPLGRNRRKGKEEARFVSFLCFAENSVRDSSFLQN